MLPRSIRRLLALVSVLVPLLVLVGGRAEATPPQARTQAQAQGPSAELAAIADRAKQAMATNRFEDAAALYRQILQALPNEPGILMNLGMALSMAGHSQEAIDPLTRALKLQPTLLPASLFLGQSYVETGKSEDAVAPLRTYVTAMPRNTQARALLASALLMSGHHRDAATEFRRVSQETPADAKAWYGLVQAYDALSQEAIDALAKTPEAPVYEPLLLADALEREGKLEEAFAFYKLSLEKLPRLRSTHDALARLYTKTGHADWAAQQTTKARAIPLACPTARPAVTPTSAECEFRASRYLGVVSATAKRTDAESWYWRARAYGELAAGALAKLAAMPPSQELHELRAELYRNQRRHQQSVQELKAALTFAPNDPRLQRELAKSIYFTRDWDTARAMFKSLLDRQPKDPELQFFYGDILLQSQQAEAAVPYLQASVAADPSMPTAHAALGRALVQLGRFADAIPHLEAVLAEDEDGSIHYQLARAYQGTGQTDRAKPLLDKYQQLQQATQSQQLSGPPPAITPPVP